jgi:cobalt-zinc-cadmium efflux system outer membrane protein
MAQFQFFDLMRTLRYQLRTTFFDLYFLQQSISVYDCELAALKTLVDAYTAEYKKGNVAFNELARLQALQFDLENEKIDVMKDVTEKQSDLILLTGDTLARPVKPNIDVSTFDNIDFSSLNYKQLLDSGQVNRYDLKITATQILSEQTNLTLQKAMRIPDLTLGANYDRVGGYIPNYTSITLSIDLPFWDHNQGNIKIAESKIEESKTDNKEKELEVKNDITKALVRLIETDKLYKSSLQKFNGNYDKLLDGITIAYQNHTISLLEFIDYYETYKNSKSEYYQLQNNRLEAIEDLNMATGITIIK